MNKSTKFVIAIGITIVIVTFLFFQLGILLQYNYFSAKKAIKEGTPVFIDIDGYSPLNIHEAEIAKQMGFKMLELENIYNPFILHGIEIHNKITNKYLSEQLGNDWKYQLDLGVDSLFRIAQEPAVIKVVENTKEVKQLNHHLDSISKGTEQLKVWYWPQETTGANVAVSRELNDTSIAIFYYYEVDPYTLEAVRIK